MTVENNLVAFYLNMYNSGQVSLLLLIDTGVSKEVFLATYKKFLFEKLITPIEELPEENKIQLVKECRDTGILLTNEKLISASKILHTIKFINENS